MSYNNEIWNRGEVIIDDGFAYVIENDLMNDEYDNEFVQSLNANKEMTGLSGKEFASLEKWKVFRPIAQTPNNIKL